MIYCKKCLTTNLRPNAHFVNGICIACNYSHIDNNDSTFKLELLKQKILQSNLSNENTSTYDCIIGVSGGKDSTRQAHWVRDRLGLRPLLVCCAYPPEQMTQIGADNLSNLIKMGFDLIVATPAPQTAAKLALKTFKKFGNVCKASEMSLFSTVPRLAIDLGVNTIFWGENPALQVGDSAVEGQDEFDGNNLRKLNTLTAGGTEWLHDVIIDDYLSNHYMYPDEVEFEKNKINIFYLGPAWDDWGNESNSIYAALQGLTLRPGDEIETGDLSNASMLDEEFTNINMMLKYYKFGFGRATDSMNEKIRLGYISREEAIKVVDKYDGVCSDNIIEKFSNYVGIEVNEFWEIVNQWINSDLFNINHGGRPTKKFKVGIDFCHK
ncbi:MAG: N-acetyl sugar amidotransferase [Candidatus Acinetobacter avistercoris]|nr:N-acetyl sugar amidotransferase [Candidatus Acinetobacter avistercoris]